MSIRVISTLQEFSDLSESWNTLLRRTAANNIFLTWEWLYTWARNYLGNNKLFILLACENNEIIGIAPLYIREVSYYGMLNLRQMEFLGTSEVGSCYLDLIVQDRKRRQVVRQVYNFLYGEARKLWDVVFLAEVPMESPSIDILYEIVQEDGKFIEIIGHTCCPVIRLSGSVEHFLKEISGNERYNLRRKSKRLHELGHVEYCRVSVNGDVQKELDTFVKLHEMRWEEKGSGGCFKSKKHLEFHREISEIFSRRGWIHLDYLILNGEKVAGIYGYAYDDRYYFYLPGQNAAIVPEVSPGKLVLFQSICQAIRDGCREYDLLRGPADYKMAWANGLRRSVTLRYYNKHLRAVAYKLLESGKAIVKVLVR